MPHWRDTILQHFREPIDRLTVVADPDGLLFEEELLATIRQNGFDLLAFDDPVAFRYQYESRFRKRWDEGVGTDLVVVLRSPGPACFPCLTTCWKADGLFASAFPICSPS